MSNFPAQFTFLGYTFRPRKAVDKYGRVYVNFAPAVSRDALKAMRQTIRGWHLQLKCDKSLADLSAMFNPILRGWHQYYGRFYESAMSAVWKHPSRMSREAHVRFCEGPQVKFLRSTHPYLWTNEGWLYLSIVLDLFNREVVGWSLKPRMTADIVTDALTMAWFRKYPAPGLLHHSDRGSQYASHAFQDKLKAYGMTCSMSRKGTCWDNAPTESWFNSFKNERVHGIRYATRADMKAASFEYIEVFYNRKRQHSTLGYRSPIQFLESWIREQH